MPFGFVPQVGIVAWLLGLHDTIAQAPTSCSLSDWAFAGTARMPARAQIRMMRDMVLSTQVQSRAVKHARSNTFFQVNCPPWAFPRCLSHTQGIGTPRWQLQFHDLYPE